jgi:hypothetical protein
MSAETLDPHPIDRYGWNTCPTPSTGLPGRKWDCVVCGRSFVAIEADETDGGVLFIEWQETS